MLETHGVLVKMAGAGKAQWLTPKLGTTTKRIHALVTTERRATAYAEDLVESNPGVVEWARAEVLFV